MQEVSAPNDDEAAEQLQRRIERWFVRRGLPHFIDRYNAAEDIFTRAAPFLTFWFVLSLLDFQEADDIDLWRRGLSLLAGLAIGLGGIGILNRLRDRPLFSRPRRIGWPEIAAFLIVPSIAAAATGVHWVDALGTFTTLVVVLVLTYVVTSYGLVPMTRWAVVQTFRQFRNVTNLFVRSLPLLLLFTMFMFFNAEMWKIVDDVPLSFLVTSIVILLVVGVAFIVLRFPRELSELSEFASWADVRSSIDDPRVAPLLEVPSPPGVPHPVPLRRRARFNVGLVLFFSQAVQVLLVVLAIFGFYILFGMFTVVPATIEQWTGQAQIDVLHQFHYFDSEVFITAELFKSAVFIAAVAGLQFTVSALVDSTYREEFFTELTGEIRESLAVRALYLSRFGEPDADHPETST